MASRTKKEAAPDSGFRIFNKPGSKERAAINLETGTVIETDGPGRLAFFIDGSRHVVLTDLTLEELAGLDPVEQADG